MSAAEIAVALGDTRRNGRGWLCKSPAHQDRTPSLSIDGNCVPIAVKCFAECDSREVLAQLRRLGFSIVGPIVVGANILVIIGMFIEVIADDGRCHRGPHASEPKVTKNPPR